ncbi:MULTISPECIES: hypothetical protein [Bacillus cereus group]|uniref:hypothetical protein n=1 Tax=Bacillus cereus group TaxID=86661 RepID=UPI000279F72D|nr:hypothetical protein [Bacillus cereus]EJR25202.1 hypothetical protein IIE_06305 [Bacillus cereus VD045]
MVLILRMINIRYVINTYIWATLIYMFVEWTVPTYDLYQNTLYVVYWIVFPLTRFLLSEVKSVFFGDLEFWMPIHIWCLYLGVKFLVFVSCYLLSFIFAPLGFLILVFQFWIAKE